MDLSSPRRVGKSDLYVTPLGFGGGTIGSADVPTQTSLDTVNAAWASGVRFFDTAPWYGLGRSERRLGLALAGVDDRDRYCINTKVGKSLVPEPQRDEGKRTLSPGGQVRTPRDPITGFRVEFDYTYQRIQSQHHESLQRLGHSRVDSLTIHDIDYGYHPPRQIEEHLEELDSNRGGGATALQELRALGAIKAIGCGCNLESRNADSWLTSAHEDLCERIADLVDLDFFVIAGGYTLLETRALRRVLPLCDKRGIGVIIAAPYASGWLANSIGTATYMYDQAPSDIVEKTRRMASICTAHNVSLAAVALQFPLAHPAVAAVIPGAKSRQEAEQNRDYLMSPVPTNVWHEFKDEGLLDPNAPTPDR